nr:hypothetical protein [Tanacetum cinerariifolium]
MSARKPDIKQFQSASLDNPVTQLLIRSNSVWYAETVDVWQSLNSVSWWFSIIDEVILGLEYPIEWIGSIKCGKEYLKGSRLVLLWRNGWWRWGQLSLSGIYEHGGEIVYGIGLVCHGGGLYDDVSEEGGGQLDEGLDIKGGGSVFGSGVFFKRHGNENESTK